MKHNFVVMDRLEAPVILGVDFLQINGLTLDFTTKPVTVCSSSDVDTILSKIPHTPVLPTTFHPAQRREAHVMTIAVEDKPSTDVVDECAVPNFGDTVCYELSECTQSSLTQIAQEYQLKACRTTPGATTAAYHYISTTGMPVCVPLHCVPAYYRAEVERQLQEMLKQGIIEESSSQVHLAHFNV